MTELIHNRYTGAMSRSVVRDFFPILVMNPVVLISITNPGSEAPDINGDWDAVHTTAIWDLYSGADETADDIERIRNIFEFIKEHKKGSIFAHCEAGLSRSAAIMEFLNRRGWFKYQILSQKVAFPNSIILRNLERFDRTSPIV